MTGQGHGAEAPQQQRQQQEQKGGGAAPGPEAAPLPAPSLQAVGPTSDGRDWKVWTFPTSIFETKFIIEEVLVSNEYFRHGIELRPGDTVVDCGANIGTFGIEALRRAPGITYLGVEPAPPTLAALRANLLGPEGDGRGAFFAHNEGFEACTAPPYPANVRLANVALSSRPGVLPFTWYPAAPGNSTLDPKEKAALQGWFMEDMGLMSASRTFEVEAVTLAALLEREGLGGDIGLLKVDVEGAELEVLKGLGPAGLERVRQATLEVHDVLPGELDGPGGAAVAEVFTKARADFRRASAAGAGPGAVRGVFASLVLPGPRGGGVDGAVVTFDSGAGAGGAAGGLPPRDGGRVMEVVSLLRAAGFGRITLSSPLGNTLNYSVAAVRD